MGHSPSAARAVTAWPAAHPRQSSNAICAARGMMVPSTQVDLLNSVVCRRAEVKPRAAAGLSGVGDRGRLRGGRQRARQDILERPCAAEKIALSVLHPQATQELGHFLGLDEL